MKELNLSEKMHCRWCDNGCDEPHSCDRNEGIYKEDVKEFIKQLKANKRFKQLGGELRDELGLDDARIIQKIQLMFMEILLDIDKLAGKDLI